MLECHTPLGTRQTPPGIEKPPRWRTPRPGIPPRGPCRPPRDREPPRMENHPPDGGPPREADSSIRSTSDRYASYWNAFLLVLLLFYYGAIHYTGQSTLFCMIVIYCRNVFQCNILYKLLKLTRLSSMCLGESVTVTIPHFLQLTFPSQHYT